MAFRKVHVLVAVAGLNYAQFSSRPHFSWNLKSEAFRLRPSNRCPSLSLSFPPSSVSSLSRRYSYENLITGESQLEPPDDASEEEGEEEEHAKDRSQRTETNGRQPEGESHDF